MSRPTGTEGQAARLLVRGWTAYAIGPVIGLATAPLLARALGPSGRGELAAILQPLAIADALAALGVPAAVVYFIGSGARPTDTLRAARQIVMVTSAAVTLALFGYAVALAATGKLPLQETLPFWLTVVWLGALVSIRRAALQGQGQFAPLDLERASGPLLRLTLVAVLFAAGVGLAWPYVVAYLLAGMTAWLFVIRRPIRALTEPSAPLASNRRLLADTRSIRRFALAASVGTVSTAMASRLDQAALPLILPLHDLGMYSVAVTVAEVPLILAIAAGRNVLAHVSAGDRSLARRVMMWTCGASALAYGVGAAIVPWVVPLAFGPAFLPAVPVTQLLLIAGFMSSASILLSAYMTGLGRPGLAAYGSLTVACVLIIGLLSFRNQMTPVVAAALVSVAQITGVLVAGILVGLSKRGTRSK